MQELHLPLRKLASANPSLKTCIRSLLAAGRPNDLSMEDFIFVNYDEGEKEVPNPHPDSEVRRRHPKVKFNTLWSSDEPYAKQWRSKIQKEYQKWMKDEEKKRSGGSPASPTPSRPKNEGGESPLGGSAPGGTSDEGSVADRLLRLRTARMRLGAY